MCPVDRRAGEVQPDHLGTALRQRHAIRAEMALQMKDALAGDQGKLCLLNRIQSAVTGPQIGELITARAEMDTDPLAPIRAVDTAPLGV